jgi:hypothetical protein
MPTDTERLDWLEKQGYAEFVQRRHKSVMLEFGGCAVDTKTMLGAETFRDAIDDAIEDEE